MGSKFSHIVGYGDTKEEAFKSLRSAFKFHYGKKEMKKCIKLSDVIQKDGFKVQKWKFIYNDEEYQIRFEGMDGIYKCYINEKSLS